MSADDNNIQATFIADDVGDAPIPIVDKKGISPTTINVVSPVPVVSTHLPLSSTSAASDNRLRQPAKRLSTTCKPPAKRPKCVAKQPKPCDKIKTPQECFENDDKLPSTLPIFNPSREPGCHLDNIHTRSRTTALDFFSLFFTPKLIETIADSTNKYAWINITKKPCYAQKDGSWKETTHDEIRKLIGLLIYQGVTRVPTFHKYWSTQSLYHGLWARVFLTRDRFKALLGMLHLVDPGSEQQGDRLRKVSSVINEFRERCKSLYQPY